MILRWTHLIGRVYQSENIIEDVVASSTVRQKLEGLCVAHGFLFSINLQKTQLVLVPIVQIYKDLSIPIERQ
jgi:hypothetical protein